MPGSGAEQLRRIAAQCKEIGDREMLRVARAELRAEAAPLIEAMQAQASARLPQSGGLNAQVASQRWRVSTRTGASTAGVRIVNSAPDTGQTDDGFVRHPVFNRRNTEGKRIFVRQEVPRAKGWATGTAEKTAPAIVARMTAVLDRLIDSIGGL